MNSFKREVAWVITGIGSETYLIGGPKTARIRIVQIVLPSGQLVGAVVPAVLGDISETAACAKAVDLLLLAGFIRHSYTNIVDVFDMSTARGHVRYAPRQDGGRGKVGIIGCVWLTQAKKLTEAGVSFRHFLCWRYRHTQGKTVYAAQVVTTAALTAYQIYVNDLPRLAWQKWTLELERLEQQLEFLVKTAGVTNKTRQVLIDDWLDRHWDSCDAVVAFAIALRERSVNTLAELSRVNKAISRYMEYAPFAEGFLQQFPEVLEALRLGSRLRNERYTHHYRAVLAPAAMQQLQSL